LLLWPLLNHSELGKLRELFEALSDELEPHMMKEERERWTMLATLPE